MQSESDYHRRRCYQIVLLLTSSSSELLLLLLLLLLLFVIGPTKVITALLNLLRIVVSSRYCRFAMAWQLR